MRPAIDRGAEPVPEAPVPLRMTLVLAALATFGPLSMDMYLPSLPAVGRDLHTPASTVALTLTACTIGLGAGQLLVGPLADRYGRRRPLALGLVLFTVCSFLCAIAPTVAILIALRFFQALGGSAGIVLSRAIARDLRSGDALSRLFALLMSIGGLAPVLAPVIGGQIVRFTSWRGVFAVLGVIGIVLLGCALALLPETLAPSERHKGGLAEAGHAYRAVLRDRDFLVWVMIGGLAFAGLFSYISASSFVLEQHFSLTAQEFSGVFAANAVVLTGATRLSLRAPIRLSLGVLAVGGTLVLAAGIPGGASGVALAITLAGLALTALGYGLVTPKVAASAMSHRAVSIGTASAVLGATQFLLGGVIGPFASIGAGHTSLVLGAALCVAACAACGLGWRASHRVAAVSDNAGIGGVR